MISSTRFCLVATIAAIVSAHAFAQRVPFCDDGQPVSDTCGFTFPNPEEVFFCEDGTMLALQNGCYRCVDVETCELPVNRHSEYPMLPAEENTKTPESIASTSPHASTNPNTTLPSTTASPPANPSLRTQVPTERAASTFPVLQDQFPDTMSSVARSSVSNMVPDSLVAAAAPIQAGEDPLQVQQRAQRASVIYFVVPVLCTLSAFAIAARSRVASQREFELLNEDEMEEINPFCENASNSQDHDGDDDHDDLEYAGGQYSDEEVPIHVRMTVPPSPAPVNDEEDEL